MYKRCLPIRTVTVKVIHPSSSSVRRSQTYKQCETVLAISIFELVTFSIDTFTVCSSLTGLVNV